MKERPLYIFLDEAGDLGLSGAGSRYFSMAAVSIHRPFTILEDLVRYRYDLIEFGLNQEYFHCSEDNRHVRHRVFGLIEKHIDNLEISALIINKSRFASSGIGNHEFYPKVLVDLLSDLSGGSLGADTTSAIVITDAIPLRKKLSVARGSIKSALKKQLAPEAEWRVLHHQSRSHLLLQVSDYVNWAIWRKWEKKDHTYYDGLKRSIVSERLLNG